MRLVRPSFQVCDRAREQISAQLDEELPELTRVRLEAHLEACAGCRSFKAELEGVATTLRAAPLEEAPFTVAIPRRRFVSVRSLQAAAAAAAVALVAGLSTLSGISSRQSSAPAFRISPHFVDRGDELVPGQV